MSQVESTDQAARGGSRFPFRVVDSALIIAIVIAVLNYAGWTYRQAYLKRFSIDPASLDSSSVAIAVDGVGAIGTTFFAWVAASVFLLVSGLCMWALVWWVERRRGSSGPLADHTAVMMGQAGGIAFALLFVIAGGSVAGRWAAEDRIANVQRGEVWTYHLKREVIPGVLIAQGSSTTWLLTKAGIRPIPTMDIRLIDGPLFDRLAAKGTATSRP
jgi:hypothetical protein